MKRSTWVLAIALAAGGCASDSLLGTDDGEGPDVSFDAFIVELSSRTLGGLVGELDTIPVLYVSEDAGTEATLGLYFGPNTVHSSSGEPVPETALTAGRQIRAWRKSPVVMPGSLPSHIAVDSIIVLD